MGEEEKKPEEEKEKKKEEEKPPKEDKKEECKDGKDESTPAPPPPPPQEIILKVFMHCEGCARKVRRCLKGFEGVEDVITDCKSHKVVVKGEKADPLKVLARVQRKSHRQVELLSPIPKPPSEEEKKAEEKEPPKPEEPKKEEPQIVIVVLRVHMHCEACAQEIKKRIMRMKGVESAEADLKSSEVKVKGGFDPPKLVEYVYKRTGKHSMIVKQDPDNKKDKEVKEEKKEDKKGGDEGGEAAKEENKEKKKEGENESSGGDGSASAEAIPTEETKVVELKNEYHCYPPRHTESYAYYPPAPQIFSDENPNACSVM